MKKGGGKNKGGGFEREVAKYLSSWMGGTNKDLWCWRSPGSGSVSTIGLYKDATGDLVAIHENAKPFFNIFSCELKAGYSDASFDDIFKDNKNDTLRSFWEQCTRDALKANKEPMLIFKKDRFPKIIGISSYIFEKIQNKFQQEFYLKMKYKELQEIVFLDYKKFFELISYEYLKEIVDATS